MKLTPEQVEALDVGTVVGRLADLKNLLFIMDSWMNSRGKVDELNREADCSKYDLEASGMNCPCITRFCGASLKLSTSRKLNCLTQQRHWMH